MTRKPLLYSGLVLLVTVLFGISLAVGKVVLPLDVWLGRGDPLLTTILLELRLPRSLLAIVVGSALSLSGAALQGYTRNPMADPGLLGVSPMAALGAVTAIFFGLPVSAPWALSAAAIVGAICGVGLLVMLAGGTAGIVTFLLSGLILTSVADSGVALALNLSPSPWAAQEIIHWLLGSLTDRSVIELRLATPFVLVGAAILLSLGRALDALTLGETGAQSLGIDLRRTQILLAIGVGLCTGASVAVTGIIGFVGLLVPHMIRPLVGYRPSKLLLPSALAGAALVLAADTMVRLVPSVIEVKLGVAMSVVGAPFFLWMLLRQRRRLA